jgi:hypothetical protein
MQALDLSQPWPAQAPDGPSPIEILKAKAGRLEALPALSGPATRVVEVANQSGSSLGPFIGAINVPGVRHRHVGNVPPRPPDVLSGCMYDGGDRRGGAGSRCRAEPVTGQARSLPP